MNHHKYCKNHTGCFIYIYVSKIDSFLCKADVTMAPSSYSRVTKDSENTRAHLAAIYKHYVACMHVQTFRICKQFTYQYYKRATRQRFLRFLHRKRPSAPWWLRLCVRVSVGVPARTTPEPASIAAAVQLRWFQAQRNRGTSCPFTGKNNALQRLLATNIYPFWKLKPTQIFHTRPWYILINTFCINICIVITLQRCN